MSKSTGKSIETGNHGAFETMRNSNFLHMVIVLGVFGTIAHSKEGWLGWLLWTVPVVFFCSNFKPVIFEAVLLFDRFLEMVGYYQWISIVDDGLLLGGIPIVGAPSMNKLLKERVTAVLSVLEPREFGVHTLIGTTFSPAVLKEHGIDHEVIAVQGSTCPSFAELDTGAAYLHSQLSKGARIYIHCRSGRGRSSSIVIAYYMRYKGMDARAAHAMVREKRWNAFGVFSPQLVNLMLYEAYWKGKEAETSGKGEDKSVGNEDKSGKKEQATN